MDRSHPARARPEFLGPVARAAPLPLLAAAIVAGCSIPATTQSLSGIALNSGALVALHTVNSADDEGRYRYACRAEMEEVLWALGETIRRANREALSPHPGGTASGGGTAAESDAAGSRPPPERTEPGKQATPVPFFEVDTQLSSAAADSVLYVITHRRLRRVAVTLVPGLAPGTLRVTLYPFEPESGAFVFLAADDSQRNALEELHERFYMTVLELLGDDVLRRLE